ncbi:MAG: hypothetical protein QOE70_5974 [Chthoniobacter sp.]|jgi:hypothetical protein|nr:hypothetical protein [Chthoniobacter sp.]
MNSELASFFLDRVVRTFSFLSTEHVFAAPTLEINDQICFATVTFMGRNLAVECILDEREGDIDCKVARVLNGKKTSHYAVDENRIRVREGVASLLRRRGVREKLFRNVSQLDLRERISITLADFAHMLKTHCGDVLDDSPSALAN